jgi:hypothetical protein
VAHRRAGRRRHEHAGEPLFEGRFGPGHHGTHRQAILGVAPTGRSCVVDEVVIFRIAHGKIAEAWEVYDEAGMWRQLGVRLPS